MEAQEKALLEVLDAVASLRSPDALDEHEGPLEAARAKLQADFGRFRTQADGAARRLKSTGTEVEARSKLAGEHAELSRSADDARLLLDILESLGSPVAGDVDGLPPAEGVPHGDVDAVAAWIDAVFERVWKRRGIVPAPETSPDSFLRRAFLDIAGVIPTAEVVERFHAAGRSLSRGAVVEEILGYVNASRGGYARNFASIWSVELLGRGYLPDDKHRQPFVEWLEKQYSCNTPYDRWVTDLLTVTKKNTKEVSPTVFLAARQSNAVANTTKIASQFLGMNLQCAECHDHPYERWTQDDFHGMVAFFARQRERDIGGNVYVLEDSDSGEATYQTPSGEKRTASMRYLDGTKLEDDPRGKDERISRRAQFASKIVEDAQFARARVNRMWAHLLGRGLVEPLDGFSCDNPPAVPAVLDFLAQKYRESGFDDRWLLRVITRSRPYGLDAAAAPGGEGARRFFAAYPVKALTGEQMLESILAASGLDHALGIEMGESSRRLLDRYRGEFLEVYAWDPEEVDDPNEGTLPQALALLNHRLVIEACEARPGSTVARSLEREGGARIEYIYRAALGRGPYPAEAERAREFLASAPDPKAAASDLLWSLLNSAEFRFNH